MLFSLAAIAGSAIVFWVLMSNFLFNSGKYIEGTYKYYSPDATKLVQHNLISGIQSDPHHLCHSNISLQKPGNIELVYSLREHLAFSLQVTWPDR